VIEVVVVNQDLDKALRLFRNRLGKEGLLTELRDREYFLTRTQRRKRKDRRAMGRWRKRTLKP
jgi:ribosomal protein S21